jgi:hypothetical protein
MISLIKEAQDFANRVAKYLKLKVVNWFEDYLIEGLLLQQAFFVLQV